MLMRLARALPCVAAGIWLGGLIVMAIVAQTTFSVMRTTGVENPAALAGQVMARNFQRFDVVQGGCAAVLAIGSVIQVFGGSRGFRTAARLILVISCSALFSYSAFVLTPRIAGIQCSLHSAEAEASVRTAFDAFHKSAVRISQAMLLLLVVLAIELAWPPPELRSSGSARRVTGSAL